jgi:DNA-3-methyladenine glycosylase
MTEIPQTDGENVTQRRERALSKADMKVLPQSFYLRDTEKVARELLGKVLCVRMPAPGGGPSMILRSTIVETEAYLGETDRACHSFSGRRTNRVESMYLEGGHSYVYLIYGMYFCLNVVTREAGCPEAVLIRAVEPHDFEMTPTLAKKSNRVKLPTNGPGKLCRHYGIVRADDGLSLFSKRSRLWIEEGEPRRMKPVATTRVGIDYAGDAKDWDLRFYLPDSPFVSKL